MSAAPREKKFIPERASTAWRDFRRTLTHNDRVLIAKHQGVCGPESRYCSVSPAEPPNPKELQLDDDNGYCQYCAAVYPAWSCRRGHPREIEIEVRVERTKQESWSLLRVHE